jgi:hypothetical protein
MDASLCGKTNIFVFLVLWTESRNTVQGRWNWVVHFRRKNIQRANDTTPSSLGSLGFNNPSKGAKWWFFEGRYSWTLIEARFDESNTKLSYDHRVTSLEEAQTSISLIWSDPLEGDQRLKK